MLGAYALNPGGGQHADNPAEVPTEDHQYGSATVKTEHHLSDNIQYIE